MQGKRPLNRQCKRALKLRRLGITCGEWNQDNLEALTLLGSLQIAAEESLFRDTACSVVLGYKGSPFLVRLEFSGPVSRRLHENAGTKR